MDQNLSISISNLQKSFGQNEILKGISIDIPKGQIVGYIGPNGAGKSTTVKILSGIIDDFQGDVQIMGYDIRKSPLDVKRVIGYIPENAIMYDMLTPREYLSFIGKLYSLDIDKIDDKSSKLLTLFEMGKVADQRMDTFSKGMKQKILLISGLLHNPEVIFLDEPLSGLDANSVIMVKEVITQLAKDGKTVFYSSHIMDVVERISDRIILINNGVIVADGTMDSLKNEKSQSLEKIFASLTGKEGHEVTAEAIIKAFEE
jgi:ABC-type multidrug transport system, ATPase component